MPSMHAPFVRPPIAVSVIATQALHQAILPAIPQVANAQSGFSVLTPADYYTPSISNVSTSPLLRV